MNNKTPFSFSSVIWIGVGLAFVTIIFWIGESQITLLGNTFTLFPKLQYYAYTIQYFIFAILWFALQVGLIYLAVEFGYKLIDGYKFIKFKVMDFDKKIKNYINIMK